MGGSDDQDEGRRSAELFELFTRGAELTRQLLDETARLRRRLADEPSSDGAGGGGTAGQQAALCDWIAKIDELQRENRGLLEGLRDAEDRDQSWQTRYAEIEERHNDLANLYVASYQLHASFDSNEVLAAISEIVINLIGAEVFALYSYDTDSCDSESGRLNPVASQGRLLSSFAAITIGTGVIGSAVAEGQIFVASPIAPDGEVRSDGDPVVVIPLYVREHALGAIALYKLFDQKSGVSELDRQLFGLLASHAATAILAARLFAVASPMHGTSSSLLDRITN